MIMNGPGPGNPGAPSLPMDKPQSYVEKFQAMQQVITGQVASNRMDNTTAISGTSYQNMRADEIIKKYHVSNSEV